jgi:hypothetical protein
LTLFCSVETGLQPFEIIHKLVTAHVKNYGLQFSTCIRIQRRHDSYVNATTRLRQVNFNYVTLYILGGNLHSVSYFPAPGRDQEDQSQQENILQSKQGLGNDSSGKLYHLEGLP